MGITELQYAEHRPRDDNNRDANSSVDVLCRTKELEVNRLDAPICKVPV